MDNTANNSCGGWISGNCAIRYTYTLTGQTPMGFGMERDPSRIVDIQNPDQYRGQLGQMNCSQQFEPRVFVVNGYVDKCDGNFLGGFFIEKIGNSGIFLGSYPSCEMDIQSVNQMGCGAVMNLQTANDIYSRGLNS